MCHSYSDGRSTADIREDSGGEHTDVSATQTVYLLQVSER